MDETSNPPPFGSNRLPSWLKTLLVVVFVSSAIWMVLCIFAVRQMGKGANKYDYGVRPMTDLERQAERKEEGDRPGPQE